MVPLLETNRLGGNWSAAASTDELRRSFAEPDAPAGAGAGAEWHPVQVPGHWQRTEAFADINGPMLYRHDFDTSAEGHPPGSARLPAGQRCWLSLGGVFYTADVWLDGELLGDTEGYFVEHTFEVTEQVGRRSEHLLALEVSCSPVGDRHNKRNLTGVYQHSDTLDDSHNPGGIWRPVTMRRTGPVRIQRHRVLCTEATATRAVLELQVTLDSLLPRTVVLRTTVAGQEHLITASLAAGETTHEWAMVVPAPELWWPRALGEPTLHDLVVEVMLGDDDAERSTVDSTAGLSDRMELHTGFRAVQRRDWIFSVNGERLFCKGAVQPPLRQFPAEEDEQIVSRVIDAALGANLDLLRFCGHVPTPEVLSACDRAGLLAWVDMPLRWGYHRSVKPQAARQARSLVEMHGHRPSVVLWCAHDEPFAIDGRPPVHAEPLGRALRALRRVGGQQLPSWNRNVLDPEIQRTLTAADPTRSVNAHSGVLPHLPTIEGTDTHLFAGWRFGSRGTLAMLARTLPRVVRFVSALGAQSVPVGAGFCEPERFPDLDWQRLRDHHGLDLPAFERHVPPAGFSATAGLVGFERWQQATQAFQADLVAHQVGALRRIKYRPAGGFAVYFLTDAAEMMSCSLMGSDGAAKPALRALADACAPVAVVADRLPASVRSGDAVTLEIHLVNDTRTAVSGSVVAEVTGPDGSIATRRGWLGAVGADDVARVAGLRLKVPTPSQPRSRSEHAPDEPDLLVVRVRFEGSGHRSAWTDSSTILPARRPGRRRTN